MNICRRFACAFVLFFLGINSFSQQVVFNDPFILDYVTKIWKGDDGLPGNSIQDIIQTSDGYVYLGTYEGLVRFDGVEFIPMNKNTESRFDFVSARTLFQDSKGNLWIGANDEGVTCVYADGSVVKYTMENGLPNNSIRAITEDNHGNIWIGTSSGIAWIKDNKIFLPEEGAVPNYNKVLVKNFYVDTIGRVWIVTEDGNGTLVYSNDNFTKYTGIKKVNPMQINSVMQDHAGVFWFGVSPHNIVKYDGFSETVYDIGFGDQKGTSVNCITEDEYGNLWCGLDTGITVFHNGEFSYMNTQNVLSDEKVLKIKMDREHNIWVATDRGGIQKFSHTKFKTKDMGVAVNAIARDEKREVTWLAADNGLLCIKNGNPVKNSITEFCKNIRVRDVVYNKDGSILVSTYEKLGQLKISPDGSIKSWRKKEGLTGNKVRVALEASDGNLYIGTTTGLNIVEKRTGSIRQITKEAGIDNDYIMCIFEDKDGTIWVGTDGGGIFLLKNGKIIKKYNTEDGLAGNVIFKISAMVENEIWICTGTGISQLKDNKFHNFTASSGLGSDSVFQMIMDNTGTVWCTSSRGIFSVKLEVLEKFSEGEIQKIPVRYYSRSDGIVSGGVTSTSRSIIDSNGCLYFTLIDGFTKYDLSQAILNDQAPIVHVQEIVIDNKKVLNNKTNVVIGSSAKRLSIKFTGLSFVSSEQVLFRYKLAGFDKDFSDWTNVRNVSYTNLKPGQYKFYVEAKNGDGILSENNESVVLYKKAPLWQHWWFVLFVLVLVSLLIFFIIKRRIMYLREDNDRLHKIYDEITTALTGTIDAKDKYTNGHSSRVAKYSKMIAARAGYSEKEQENIYMVAILHDIGKIGVPDSIINKPGKLTDEEYAVIKTHPVIGGDILKSITSFKGIEVGARSHHERYDGKGYPDGLKGEEIPEVARIIGVADAYDAMTSNRSYRNYLPQAAVREQIEKGKGTQFDPFFAEKMLEIIDEDKNYALHG